MLELDLNAELAAVEADIASADRGVSAAFATLHRAQGARNFILMLLGRAKEQPAQPQDGEGLTDKERAEKILSIANAPRKPQKGK